MNKTGIEYLDYTWNPVHGCSPLSAGCKNCWAKGMAERLACIPSPGYSPDDPFKVVCSPEKLDEPLRVKKPAVIGVTFMGDLFHEEVPGGFIEDVFDIIDRTPRHRYIILTKRLRRMSEFTQPEYGSMPWPDNIIAGTSIEDQKTADERIPWLLKTPAATRMVSFEPAISAVSLRWALGYDYNAHHVNNEYDAMRQIDWIVMGGESGPGARPMHPDWARSMQHQCSEAGVPFYFKQHGEWITATGEEETFGSRYGWLTLDGRFAPEDNDPDELWDESGSIIVSRVGKKAAGNLLDGVVHDALPEVLR